MRDALIRSRGWTRLTLWCAATLAASLLAMAVSSGVRADEAPAAAAPLPSGVAGKVIDAETGETLAYANVVLFAGDQPAGAPAKQVAGAAAGGDGTFRVVAPPGRYLLQASYLGYQTIRVTGVQVKEGTFARLDVNLRPTTIEVGAVEVTAHVVRNSTAAILARQQKAAAVSDGLSAEQIRRTPDATAAEALQRVTGLSLVNGRYIYVRGLGERYSATQVNGTTIGTPEPNKRVVPLDIFASDLLDNVTIQKTYTPDQPGEFGGGVVDVRTRDFPGGRVGSISIGSSYNDRTTGQAYLTYSGSNTDFLGFSNGVREIPDLVSRLAKNQMVKPRGLSGLGFSADTVAAMGRSFNRIWEPERKTARPAFNFAGSYGDELNVLGRPLGFLGSLTLNNSYSSYDFEENMYESDTEEGGLTPHSAYRGTSSQANVLWGALGHLSYRLGERHVMHLRGLYNRSAENQTRVYEGLNQSQGIELRDTRLRYVERGLLATSLSMEHNLPRLLDSRFEWRLNYSQADRNEPDRREYIYELWTVGGEEEEGGEGGSGAEPQQVWTLSGRSDSWGFTRLYGFMSDIERGGESHWTIPFHSGRGRESQIKIGASYRTKDRGMNLRRFAYDTPQGGAIDLTQNPAQLLTDEHIGSARQTFRLMELTRNSDSYAAAQEVTAAYGMTDLRLASWFRLVTGLRMERSDQRVTTNSPYAFTEPVGVSLSTTDALPSINLALALRRNVNLRLAYSTTLSRPDLRELTPFALSDFQDGFEEKGNPELRRARIHNYDLRLEAYPRPDEMMAVSVFYKDLVDPIEQSVVAGDGLFYVPINGDGGYLRGLEVETRLGLGRVSPALGRFAVSGNLALVHSRTKLPSNLGVGHSRSHPFQGQSPYVVNTGLFYTSSGGNSGVSLLYNVFGRRLARVGAFTLPDIYEQARQSLDLTFNHAARGARVKLAFENLLNDEVRFEQSGQTTHRSEKGRSASLSVGYGVR